MFYFLSIIFCYCPLAHSHSLAPLFNFINVVNVFSFTCECFSLYCSDVRYNYLLFNNKKHRHKKIYILHFKSILYIIFIYYIAYFKNLLKYKMYVYLQHLC